MASQYRHAFRAREDGLAWVAGQQTKQRCLSTPPILAMSKSAPRMRDVDDFASLILPATTTTSFVLSPGAQEARRGPRQRLSVLER